jgi:hypothetical protein
MKPRSLYYIATCESKDCPEHIAIPVPNPPESFVLRPYLPEGSWPLLFACPECRRGSVLSPSDFRLETLPKPESDPDDEVWWFLEVRCSTDNCGFPVRLHTIASAICGPDDVTRIAAPTLERFRCPSRHQLTTPIGILRAPSKLHFA